MPIDIDTLNEPQREAVVTTEGPLLVLAGAGSGKTRVLTYRIANLIENKGVAPWEILAITFTNKAAAEMRERLAALVGPRSRGMWVSTFHSMCVRILRADAERLGFTRNFTIYDTDDQKRLYKEIMAELDIDPKRFPVNALMNRISSGEKRARRAGRLRKAGLGPGGEGGRARVRAAAGTPEGCECLRLRRPAALRVPAAEEPCRRAGRLSGPFPLPHGGRVPGHEPRPVRHHGASGRQAPEHHGGGRRRPVHLQLARRRHPQHPGVRAGLPERAHGEAGTELPQRGQRAGRGQRRHREQPAPQAEEAVHQRGRRREDQACTWPPTNATRAAG